MNKNYDVVVVGSGPAGCVTALLYAIRGFKVALVERRKELDSFKPVCTHFVQGCATPILDEIGVLPSIKAAGAVKNHINIWTKFGWIKPSIRATAGHHGYVIRRQTLDPILRKQASLHSNIELFMGWRAIKLIESKTSNVIGVEVENAEHKTTAFLRAKLTVGADGRTSAIAGFLNTRHTEIINRRTFFVTYYKNLDLKTGSTSQLWFWKNDIAYAFPSDGDVTLLCLGVHDENMQPFKEDAEKNFHDYFRQLPDGPDMDVATRVAPVTKGKHMHTIRRHYEKNGVALVGDALFAVDPFAGTGIGWAVEGAAWLVNETEDALKSESSVALEISLQSYLKKHQRNLRGHAWMISNYSSGRDFNYVFPPERLLFSAAVHRQDIADLLDLFLNRVIGFKKLISPALVFGIILYKFQQYFGSPNRKSDRGCAVNEEC